jgi:hypothetical protein
MDGSGNRSTHTVTDLIYDALYIAGVGGGMVALFFLVYDVFTRGDAFFTPSLMGSVLFEHLSAASVQTVSMEAMVKFTLVHIGAFSVLGLVLSWLTHQAELRSRHPALVVGLVFVALEVAFWVGTSVLIPGVLERIGVIPVAAANLLAAVGIGLFLVSSHRPELWTQFKRRAHLGRGPHTS